MEENQVSTLPKPKQRKLSPSSIATFKQCPKKWEFRYIEKIREMPGLDAVRGTFVHTVLEDLMQLPSEDRTQENAKKIAREKYDGNTIARKDYKSLELDESEALEFRKEAWNQITGIWHLEDPTQVEVYSTELEINTMLGDVSFRSYIDRVDETSDGHIIVDYKSGKFPTSDKFVEEKLDQVRLYAAAFEAAEGMRPREVRLYYPCPSNKTRGDVISELVSEEILEVTLENLKAVDVEIKTSTEAEDFPAKVGPLCAWCSYVNRCPEGKQEATRLYQNGRMRADAPAVELLGLTS